MPIIVTTPTRGRASAASRAISPGPCMPISSTAAVWAGSRRSSVSGRPVSLFRLPSVRSTRWRTPSTAAVSSLVDVLPLLPVMPTTSGATRPRTCSARSYRARQVSATWTTAAPRLETSRSVTSATAPRAAALAQNAWPSRAAPRSAKKHPAGSTARESVWKVVQRASGEPAASRPPVAATISATVSSISR